MVHVIVSNLQYLCNCFLYVAEANRTQLHGYFTGSHVTYCPTVFDIDGGVAASGPTIWTSTYGLEPVLCYRLLIELSGRAQTVHMFTRRFTYHVTQYSRRSLNAFFFSSFCACIYNLAEPYFDSFRQ